MREAIPIHIDDLEKMRRAVESARRKMDGSKAGLVAQLIQAADKINAERDEA